MDLTVPSGIGGREAAPALKELDPEVRIIVSSGYANDPVMAKYREYGFKAVIPKPYRMQDLATVVHRVVTDTC